MHLKKEDLINIKGELSFSEIMSNNQSNIANHYNTHRFRQMIEGNINSPALTYLLNMGHMSISDYTTLDYFNSKMIAVKEMVVGYLAEEKNQRTINLETKFKNKKIIFNDILNHRKSIRKFSPIKLGFKRFSQNLSVLCDMERKQTYMNYIVPTRAYGSGGGLYPISVYLLILNVSNVESGWYKLQPHTHTIQFVNSMKSIDVISGNNIETKNASYIIFYGFDLTKSYPKYGESSVELALKEVGEMSQLVDLQSTVLSLGSCQSAGFNKKLVHEILSLDGVTEQILHSQIIGEI